MKIRKIQEADYPAILHIYSLSKLDELQFEQRVFELLPLDQDEKRFSALSESDIYVLEDTQFKDGERLFEESKVIAYGAVYGSEIRALFVHPVARGKGAGKVLLEFLLSNITGVANLYIAKTNAPARHLYERYGFKIVNEFQTEYNGVPVLANEMARSIEV